ncbi:hypothetical protein HanPI659440_Chr02g0043511 [Helianthus annuus]|nr:hypothetical protein HanPI659440_Chr02g0043511 [Helianthus annuus]
MCVYRTRERDRERKTFTFNNNKKFSNQRCYRAEIECMNKVSCSSKCSKHKEQERKKVQVDHKKRKSKAKVSSYELRFVRM